MQSVSIIIPVYNVEQYVEACFCSVAAQTWRGELECIFVDDCGSDGSMAVVERLVEGYDGKIRFRILRHEHNRGLSAARNTGIRAAAGDYLFFLDSDDTITPDCIELLAAHVVRHPVVDVVVGRANSKMLWVHNAGKGLPEYSDNFKWIRTTMLKRVVIPTTAWNRLVRRQLVVDNGLFFVEGRIHEDEIWNFFLAKHVRSMAFEPKRTYNYTENPHSIMQSMARKREPMLRIMMDNVTGPCAAADVLCMLSFHSEDCGDAMDVLAARLHGVKCVVSLGRKYSKYPMLTVRGVWYRALYLTCIKLLKPYWNHVAANGLPPPPQKKQTAELKIMKCEHNG